MTRTNLWTGSAWLNAMPWLVIRSSQSQRTRLKDLLHLWALAGLPALSGKPSSGPVFRQLAWRGNRRGFILVPQLFSKPCPQPLGLDPRQATPVKAGGWGLAPHSAPHSTLAQRTHVGQMPRLPLHSGIR